jgi:hypothetical protein
MFRLVILTAVFGWLSLVPVLWRLRRALKGTSLSGVWVTLALAWLAWGAAGAANLLADLPAGAVDLAWYSVAVVMLIPPIAVLGARRPIHRVWPWFVLLPLLCVFAWPAFPAFGRGRLPAMWNLEEPLLAGYALVLLMGAGNYIGLRSTLPALLWIGALVLLAGPLCPTTAAMMPAPPPCRAWATLFLSVAGWTAVFQANRSSALAAATRGAPFQQVWLDFRDTFGIVWARRVEERFNEGMRQKGEAARLGMHGLESASGTPDLTPCDWHSAETSLRWLLQKFVDPEWIDARVLPEKKGTGPLK